MQKIGVRLKLNINQNFQVISICVLSFFPDQHLYHSQINCYVIQLNLPPQLIPTLQGLQVRSVWIILYQYIDQIYTVQYIAIIHLYCLSTKISGAIIHSLVAQNDVTTSWQRHLRCNYVVTTLWRRHYDVLCYWGFVLNTFWKFWLNIEVCYMGSDFDQQKKSLKLHQEWIAKSKQTHSKRHTQKYPFLWNPSVALI